MSYPAKSSAAEPAKRGRGRPPSAATWRTLADVSDITGVPEDVLARLLKRVPNTIPGAIEGKDGWEVPERGLRALLGGRIEQYATVAEVADALRLSESAVYDWITRKLPPDGRTLLESRTICGRRLIPVRALVKLPERHPAPFSFFSTVGASTSDAGGLNG
jgi:hypothetical protein